VPSTLTGLPQNVRALSTNTR